MTQPTLFDDQTFVPISGVGCRTDGIFDHDTVACVGLVDGDKRCANCIAHMSSWRPELKKAVEDSYGKNVWARWSWAGAITETGRLRISGKAWS